MTFTVANPTLFPHYAPVASSGVVRRHRDRSLILLYRLTSGRFIVGYALAENGMLFRGELVTGRTDDEARRAAVYISNFFAAYDAEDEANFDPDA
jgi:hypothetical protein